MRKPSARGRRVNARVGRKPKEWIVETGTRHTEQFIKLVQEVYGTGKFTQKELAEFYQVSSATISKIVNMRRI